VGVYNSPPCLIPYHPPPLPIRWVVGHAMIAALQSRSGTTLEYRLKTWKKKQEGFEPRTFRSTMQHHKQYTRGGCSTKTYDFICIKYYISLALASPLDECTGWSDRHKRVLSPKLSQERVRWRVRCLACPLDCHKSECIGWPVP
jgi:hypothetical protein